MMLRWYLVQTKPSGEAAAEANLERQAYEVYLPRVVQSVRTARRWIEQITPLFPRYLFVGLDEGRQPLAPVRYTLGVASVVCFGSEYAVVPDEVVRDLRRRADPVSGLHRLSCAQMLVPGDKVSIAAGPFMGLEGVFQRQAGPERVVVLLELLGGLTTVRVSADFVLPSHAI